MGPGWRGATAGKQHPDEVLNFKSPYEAVARIVNPATILTVGDLIDKYVEWAEGYLTPMRNGRAQGHEVIRGSLEPYNPLPHTAPAVGTTTKRQ